MFQRARVTDKILIWLKLNFMDLQAEVSIMKMSRRVAGIESSSNREVALLEELEDENVNFGMSSSCNLCIFTYLCLTAILFLLLLD